MHSNERYRQARQITLIGAASNVLLGLIKLVGGLFFHSHALVADGVHSFSDLFTDGMVLIASKYGSQDADDLHPYGHQRIETAATLLLAMLLILAGAGIAWDSIDEMFHKAVTMPSAFALPIAILSILFNEVLFHYTRRVGNRIHSPLIIANAWHHRSDAAASGVVLLGLLGSVAGFTFLDPLAAVIIGGMIIKMGINYGWNSVKELVDTGVESQKIAQIEQAIQSVDGVKRIHQLRNRMMGRDVFIDLHILVSPFISVSEGHYIAQKVHQTLIKHVDHVKDVTVHVDPEDDELISPSLCLPNRSTIESSLLESWQKDYPDIESWIMHYLDGKVLIDIITKQPFNQWQALQERIEHDLPKERDVTIVRLLSIHGTILGSGT
ncbi:MAG: cation diffusion facilitator family transporter [Legionellaceae bacterium]|nr:cation diffusion facilitator family transporter [Legionellaceae bacterium]